MHVTVMGLEAKKEHCALRVNCGDLKGQYFQSSGLEDLPEPQDDEGSALPQFCAATVQVMRQCRRLIVLPAGSTGALKAGLLTGCTRRPWAGQTYLVSAVWLCEVFVTGLPIHLQPALINTLAAACPDSSTLPGHAAVAGGAVCIWLAQEWGIHAKLLHSQWSWFGTPLRSPGSTWCTPGRVLSRYPCVLADAMAGCHRQRPA